MDRPSGIQQLALWTSQPRLRDEYHDEAGSQWLGGYCRRVVPFFLGCISSVVVDALPSACLGTVTSGRNFCYCPQLSPMHVIAG
jgi:hypothetical protein